MKLEYGLLIATSRGESVNDFERRVHRSWCNQPLSGFSGLAEEELKHRFIARIKEAISNTSRNPAPYLREMKKLGIKTPISLDDNLVGPTKAMIKLQHAHSNAVGAFKSFLDAVIPKNPSARGVKQAFYNDNLGKPFEIEDNSIKA